MNNRILSLLVALVLMTSCADTNYTKNKNGITVERGDMTINIEVIDESIIHITKTKQGIEVDTLPDFVTILEPQRTKWRVSESGDVVTLTTPKINLSIYEDGVVEYLDRNGKRMVVESEEATWIDSDGTISQGFVAGDEAIYGLGQYQSGVMNLRGVPVRMDQFNQEIVIPFIVSTKGYGIYWHNYSSTFFNRAEHLLSFDAKDVETDEAMELKAGVEAEDVAQHAAKKVSTNSLTTTFTPEQSGLYTFHVKSDDKSRMRGSVTLTIDGDEVVHYSTIWMPMCYSGSKELTKGRTYEVTFENNGASVAGDVRYNEPDFNKTTFTSAAGTKIEYYLVAGDTPDEVIYNYQDLTGRAPMFSEKSYGFWHCRERFHNQSELLENAREYRKRNIPVDNIVQDWFYWPEKLKSPQWDRVKYPDPKAMCEELDDLNLNLMVSVWPTVTNEPLLKNYGILDSRLGERGDFLDFYDENVQKQYYKMLSDSMFHFGVKSIWLDGSEPEAVAQSAMTVLGEFRVVDNPYSLLVSKSVYEGRREEFGDERVFNLTRSAYAGQQRYGVTSWSGDVAGTWEQLAEQIPAGLNFSMAGVPYWTHDIGGFFRDSQSLNPIYDDQYTNKEYRELLARWFQFGAFSPIFRIHGYKSETEVWRYGKEFENIARKYIYLRYNLLPYIYSQAWRVTKDSRLFISPLAYSYPDDKRTWDIKDQYLFGESIMVCPVVEYEARTKRIYLPEGEWFNFWSDERFEGGREIEVSAKLDELPLMVKAGSIIPLGARVQYVDQPTNEPTRLKIYGGKDASYELYFDAGESYEYESGEYSILSINYNAESNSVTLEVTHDEYVDFANNPMSFVIEDAGDNKDYVVIVNSKRTTVNL